MPPVVTDQPAFWMGFNYIKKFHDHFWSRPEPELWDAVQAFNYVHEKQGNCRALGAAEYIQFLIMKRKKEISACS